MNTKEKILVTGAGGDSGLGTIRILKDSGFYVYACDANEFSSGLHFADAYSIIPYAIQEEKFLKNIQEIISNEEIDIVFPNVDEELPLFAEHENELGARIVISPIETIKICQDKAGLLDFLKNDTPIPKPYMEGDVFPLIVRPRISRGSRNIHFVKNKRELDFFKYYIESQDLKPMIQEYLPGREYTVDILCDFSGNLITMLSRERIATKGGICSIGKIIKESRFDILVEKILNLMEFRGPINIQFKEDANGILKLLEINPRCSGGLPITYNGGLNIPLLTIKLSNQSYIRPDELDYEEKMVFRFLSEI